MKKMKNQKLARQFFRETYDSAGNAHRIVIEYGVSSLEAKQAYHIFQDSAQFWSQIIENQWFSVMRAWEQGTMARHSTGPPRRCESALSRSINIKHSINP